MKVFISSTSVDLQSFREAACAAVRAAGHEPINMENFPAGTQPTAEDCRARVAECGLVVALIAWRKGSVPSRKAGGDGVRPYTAIEIDCAREKGIEVLYFLGDEYWPMGLCDRGADLEWIEKYRADISQIAGSFAHGGASKAAMDALRAMVNNALNSWQQDRLQNRTGGPGAGLDPLEDYLQQVAKLQRAHCTATGDTSHATLQQVYVELALHPEERRAQLQPLLELRRDGRDGLTLPQLVEWGLGQPTPLRHWMLRGDPGSGKTTVLRHLALTFSSEPEAEGAAAWVPIYLTAAALDDQHSGTWLGLAAKVVPGRSKEVEAALRGALRDRRLLVLIDGLDEVADPGPVQRWVSQIAGELGERHALVVTSRFIPDRSPVPAGDPHQRAFVKVELSRFSPQQRSDFLGRWWESPWFDAQDQRATRPWKLDEAIDRFERSPHLRELAELPLHLTLLAQQLDRGEPLSHHRMDLYVTTMRGLFERRHNFGGPVRPVDCLDEVIDVLAALAFALTDPEQSTFELRTLLSLLGSDPRCSQAWQKIRTHEPWGRERGAQAGAFLSYVSETTSLLRPCPHDQALWQFPHRSYREALAAMVLAKLPTGQLVSFAKTHARAESRWIEPLVMAVGAHEEPDALVRALLGTNPHVAWRVLATAHRLQAKTVEELLALNPDDLDERFKAITKIPGLVSDPQAAIDLLLRIAQPREGVPYADDVYFAHEALEAVGRQPEARDAATTAIRLLYQRLPEVPKGELFERIRVPHGGNRQVDLWHHVPAGTSFRMGSPKSEANRSDDEGPVHSVTFKHGYRIAVVPVTNAMFLHFDPSFEPETWKGVPRDELLRHPAVNVSWYAAASFCRWLAHRDPTRFGGARLPTEAEWECAARAGTPTAYWRGNDEAALAEVGWYRGNSEGRTHRVGELRPNAWGLYDVHGNVWEWSCDWYHREYTSSPEKDPRGPDSGHYRVVRGGSWGNEARGCRSAFRNNGNPRYRGQSQGFRVVVSAAPELDP